MLESVYWLFGLPFDCIDLTGAVQALIQVVERDDRLVLATPNLNFLRLANQNDDFHGQVLNSGLSLVDGMPLVWLGRVLGIPFSERVAGSTLIERLSDRKDGRPLSIFFFGGEGETADLANDAVNSRRSGLRGVGALNPGFRTIEAMSAPDITDTINASEADLLCISLGAAKGHAWIERNRDRLTTPVISHLGALVNFFAGTVSRAPRWMQNSGLEWLWRTAMEPRLVARYAKDAVYLLSLISLSVLPLLCLRFAQRKEIRCARLEIDRSESNGLRFALKGVLTEQTLSLLSTSIRDDLGKSSLTLDLSGVTYLDSRALGYLYALRFRCDERICIVGDGGRLRLLLRLHKAKSLMTSL